MAKNMLEGLMGIIPMLFIFPLMTKLFNQWSQLIAPKQIYYNQLLATTSSDHLAMKLQNLPNTRCLVTIRAQVYNTSYSDETVRIYLGFNANPDYDFDAEDIAINSAYGIRNATIPAKKWESICETFLPSDTPAKRWEGKYLICQTAGAPVYPTYIEIICIPV